MSRSDPRARLIFRRSGFDSRLRRHITVFKNVLNASLNKTLSSFLIAVIPGSVLYLE